MVLVNSLKYACQSCIKGHRSSSCRHNDRPLFEVQKKGRPVSQCEKCREMREKKRVHGKCCCNGTAVVETPGPRHWKYDFANPDLPNGLKDLACPTPVVSASKQHVHDLLNACECGDNCQCGAPDAEAQAPNVIPKDLNKGLAVLAHAASLLAADTTRVAPPKMVKGKARKRIRDGSVSPNLRSVDLKRTKQTTEVTATPPAKSSCCSSKKTSPPVRGPQLPPIGLTHLDALEREESLPKSHPLLPSFPMPSIQDVSTIAGSGCCCGFECTCPGCEEHRGVEHADRTQAHGDCASGMCSTCIDNTSELKLSMSLSNFIEAVPALNVPGPSAAALDALFAGVSRNTWVPQGVSRAARPAHTQATHAPAPIASGSGEKS